MQLHPAVLSLQGTVEAFKLREYASYDQGFIRDTMLTLVGGCMVLTHLSEEHDSVGLGSGTTLLIAISILLRGHPLSSGPAPSTECLCPAAMRLRLTSEFKSHQES